MFTALHLLLLAAAPVGGDPFIVIDSPADATVVGVPNVEIEGRYFGSPGPQTVFEVFIRTTYSNGSFSPPINGDYAYNETVLGYPAPIVDWNEVAGRGNFSGRARWLSSAGVNDIHIYLPGDVLGSPTRTLSVGLNQNPVVVPEVALSVHPVQRSVDTLNHDGSVGSLGFYVDLINTTFDTTLTVDLEASVTLPDETTVDLPMGELGALTTPFTIAPGDLTATSPIDPVGMLFEFDLDQAPFPLPIQEGEYLLDVRVRSLGALVHEQLGVGYWVSDRSAKSFRDVTATAGLDVVRTQAGLRPAAGNAIGAFDYDNDGWTDLFFTNPSGALTPLPLGPNADYPGGFNFLMQNQGDGTFQDRSVAAGVAGTASVASYGVAWGDVDADGDDDFVVANRANRPYVYRNQLVETAGATFVDVGDGSFGSTSKWHCIPRLGDYDLDGDLDLYLGSYLASFSTTWVNIGSANELWRNEHIEGIADPLTPDFPAFTRILNSGTESVGDCLAAFFTDHDRDGLPDLAVYNDFGPFWVADELFRGNGTDFFTDVSVAQGFDVKQFSMGAVSVDLNGDLAPEIYTTSIGRSSLLINDGFGGMTQGATGSGADGAFITEGPTADGINLDDGWGVAAWDFDLDADWDLYACVSYLFTGGQADLPEVSPDSLYDNDGAAQFTKRSEELGLANAAQSHGVVCFDYDNDGDLDVVTSAENEGVTLMRNDLVTTNHFLTLEPVATRSAPGAFGARVEVTTSAGTQALEYMAESAAGGQTHAASTFGLGSDTAATVVAHWPRGGKTSYYGVDADQYVELWETVVEVNGAIDGIVPANSVPDLRVKGEPGSLMVASVGMPGVMGPFPLPGGGLLDIFPLSATLYISVIGPSAEATGWFLGTMSPSLAGFTLNIQGIVFDAVTGQVPVVTGVSTLSITR